MCMRLVKNCYNLATTISSEFDDFLIMHMLPFCNITCDALNVLTDWVNNITCDSLNALTDWVNKITYDSLNVLTDWVNNITCDFSKKKNITCDSLNALTTKLIRSLVIHWMYWLTKLITSLVIHWMYDRLS